MRLKEFQITNYECNLKINYANSSNVVIVDVDKEENEVEEKESNKKESFSSASSPSLNQSNQVCVANANSSTCNNSAKICTCIVAGERNYDEHGKLSLVDSAMSDANRFENIYPIYECSPECACDEASCGNRVVQNGGKFELQVFDCGIKGKCMHYDTNRRLNFLFVLANI